MKLFDLKDQVAIITGASRGIGEAIALRFAEHGASLVLVARKPDALHGVVERIKANGGRALGIPGHTGKLEDVKAVVAKTIEHFGKVDILVNNAATNPYFGPMMETEDAAWDKTFEVNVKGYFMMMREVANHLTSRGAPGSLINLASILGQRGSPFQGVYGMTKAAVIQMTMTLAQELGGSNIRVNAIAPGLIETKFAQAIVGNEDMLKRVVDRTALGRHGQPDEIAGAAVFLASQASSYMTGQVITVDGGTIITT
jgi:NAD(P)-dependent dehydrogenase (short-subunit alcohol dehydrogenase family)